MSAIETPASAAQAAGARLLERPLVYVTGKGGCGKTTVAGAIGLAAAASGRRTLVCELAGARHLPDAFAVRVPRGGAVHRLAGRLSWLSIDPRQALVEWMRRQPGGAVAAAVLTHSRAFGHFVDAAPGAKELITIGKFVDLSSASRDGGGHAPRFDLVVIDGPSTGHALAMLEAPRSVARATPVGPIGQQARTLHAVLADPASTGYVGVALPEEMSVHELVDLEQGLRETVGRGLDLVVVNGVYPDRFSDDEADRLRALAADVPSVGAALAEHRRAREHARRVQWLREHVQTPVATLPFVFTALDQAVYGALGRRLVPG